MTQQTIDMNRVQYRQFCKSKYTGLAPYWHYWGYIKDNKSFITPMGPMDDDLRESFQFTGLYDNTRTTKFPKGKKIWEGSILKYDDKDFPETAPDIGVVEWCEGWVVKEEGSYASDSLQDFLHGNHVTVIGDVMENPKLMEMKK